MKITIKRDYLIQALNEVTRAISSRTAIPILTGIKLTINDEGAILTGSDTDISIEAFIPLEKDDEQLITVEKYGSIVLPSRYVTDIVKRLPNDEVSIEVTEGFQTLITSGTASFTLNGLDANDYPQLPEIGNAPTLKIPADMLKNLIRQTAFAVSTVEVRPVLTGVNWILKEGTLLSVATDSHRLALRKINVDLPEEAKFNIVIPGKSLTELNKILDDTTEKVEVVVNNNQILFKVTDVLFYSRLLEGNYPDTTRLIPTSNTTTVAIAAKSLLQAIDRASLLARDNRNNVIKLVSTDNKEIEISSNSPEVGNVSEDLIPVSFEGESILISFNGKYMIDALRVFENQDVKIEFSGSMHQFVIRPVDHEEGNDILQLITPVRTF